MAYAMKNGRIPPLTSGDGKLDCRGYAGAVAYEIQGSFTNLRAGSGSLRGSLTADPEIAAKAFQACDGYLTLADGKSFRVTMSGHTPGSATTYFDLKV
jgi:hypothetical protein